MPTDTDLTPEGNTGLIDTDYEIGQDNVEASVGPFDFDIHNPVFVVSGLTIVLFTTLTLLFPETAGAFLFWLRPELRTSGRCPCRRRTAWRTSRHRNSPVSHPGRRGGCARAVKS